MYTWNYEECGLWEHDLFETIDECIDDARKQGVSLGESIYIGEPDLYIAYPDIETLLENMEYHASEECGEAADAWCISYKKGNEEAWDELTERVIYAVNEYLKKIGQEPDFYKIINVEKVEVM